MTDPLHHRRRAVQVILPVSPVLADGDPEEGEARNTTLPRLHCATFV
jgi:hypothetical protein